MKKKFLFLSALVAATTAFVSCSSDENLAEVPDVVEETPAKTGTPFSVVVANDDGTTRATLIDNTSLGSFKLFAKQGSAAPWINGNVFKFEDSKWNPYQGSTAVEMSWPTEDTETVSNFYAYSDNSTNGITVSATPTTSCVTTDNLANGSFVYKFYTATGQTLQNGPRASATSTIEDIVVDLDKQSDLLVASATQNEAAGTTVPLHFRHALSSLALKARFTSHENGSSTGAVDEGMVMTIYWIRIYGLKGGGTFTFPATDDYDATTHRWGTSPWTTAGGSEVVYEWNFGDSPIVIEAEKHTTGDITKTSLIPHTEMMVIPQSFTSWDGDVTNFKNCYVVVCMKTIQNDATPFRQYEYYMPFTIASTSNEFLTGVKHTITLNLNYLINSDGEYIFHPSDIVTAPPFAFE